MVIFSVFAGLVCLFWMMGHLFLASRTDTLRVFVTLMLALFFSGTGDLIFSLMFHSETVSHLLILFFVPSVIPLSILYLSHLCRPYSVSFSSVLWCLVPVCVFVVPFALVCFNGLWQTDLMLQHVSQIPIADALETLSGTERIFFFWLKRVFPVVMIVEFILFMIYVAVLSVRYNYRLSHLFGFFRHRSSVRLVGLQTVLLFFILLNFGLKYYFAQSFLQENPALLPVLSIIQSFLYFLFGYYALFGAKEFITYANLESGFRFNYKEESCSEVSEKIMLDMAGNLNAESLARVLSRMGMQAESLQEGSRRPARFPSLASVVFGASPKAWDTNGLQGRFQQLMLREQLFLQPSLTLTDVAERLGTNKTYLSKMVNQTYNLGFPEVLNILRVDYSQQYIRSHPMASQEEIAKACGFLSASSFNGTFKRITGVTPKVWASRSSS